MNRETSSKLLALTVLFVVGALASCSDDSSTEESRDVDGYADATADTLSEMADELPAWPEDKYISPEDVYARVVASDPEMLAINVSDEEFYSLGHIEGSIAIPWDTLDGRLDEVPSDRHIVVYCRRGVRSEAGHTTLVAHGYDRVWVMTGGLEVWLELSYPVVTHPD